MNLRSLVHACTRWLGADDLHRLNWAGRGHPSAASAASGGALAARAGAGVSHAGKTSTLPAGLYDRLVTARLSEELRRLTAGGWRVERERLDAGTRRCS
jgi:hypothetical protein